MASADLSSRMESVVDDLWSEGFIAGKLFERSASARRYGNNGSLSIDLVKGTWHDHSGEVVAPDGTPGGGVYDLVCALLPGGQQAAVDWMIQKGHMEPREKANGAAAPQQGQNGEKFAGFMDHWPVAIFEYHDDRGKLAYEVLKMPKGTGGPAYMQRRPHPSGKGWIWGLQEGEYGKIPSGDWFKKKPDKKYGKVESFPAATRWLYRRDEVLKAKAEGRVICLTEGEKDAETVRSWGFTATTNAGGAKFWSDSFYDDLAGATVVLLPDNDDVGRQRATVRGAGLRDRAKEVRVLDLSLHWQGMPEKADVTDWKDQAGGDADKFALLIEKAPLWKPEDPPSKFGAFTWRDLDAPGADYDYIIDDWFTDRGRSVIGGPSQSGKSFFAIHTAMSVALGRKFFGHGVQRGGVIYQAGEGGHGIKKRFKAYRQHFEVPEDEDVPMVILPAKVDLFSREGDTEKLIEEIKAWEVTMSYPLRLIVIDTLATATIGADENSGKDMGQALSNIALIEERCRCHVALVHHMNADGKKLRGHTSIHANVDQVINISCDETKIRTAKLTKQKDDEDGLSIKFALKRIEVGTHPRTGRTVTSCAVVTVGEKEQYKAEQEKQGFVPTPVERKVLTRLFDAIEKHGQFVATAKDGPKEAVGKTVVSYENYRAAALERMVEIDDRKKATDKIRNDFERSKDKLLQYRVINFSAVKQGDASQAFIWWTGRPVKGFPHTFKKDPDGHEYVEHTLTERDQEAFGPDGELMF